MGLLTYSLLAILVGMRHGMDGDHVAALADMVGSEKKKRKQLSMGLMYAFGHSSIVLLIGLVSIFIGLELSEGAREAMECLVSVTLIALGSYMLLSVFKQKDEYEYKSRVQIAFDFFGKLSKKSGFGESGQRLSPIQFGVASAFIIGVIHGIGVESPTQIALLSNVIGENSLTGATFQLILFVIGLLVSTILISVVLTWGFMKARIRKALFLALGSLTGVYSLWLGATMLIEILKGGF
ncbi:High-affinity nickel-transporter [Bacillus sp. DNRA2]|uniref:HoxN/HupN/NixA family nickel/cobalt transporter n=1 Tax=Bacillus sp. DNRA2 TaxID=2723053 RepID=UPI00145F5726|nr:High-affinity nickel-transporter [Bacillus sp. DNRA2]NMD69678.1 High-affinity nickel-transporter [Bacillus sp. DNRA2]